MLRRPALLIVVLMGLGVIGCSRSQPIYKVTDAPVLRAGGQLDEDQVRAAIIAALRESQWIVRQERPAKILAERSFRTHRADIQINYSRTKYSILYRHSKNLLFDGSSIRQNYNKLVKQLETQINRQLTFILELAS